MSWNKAELTSVCEVFADGDWIESKDQSEDGIRLIQTGNIGFGRFKARDSKARYISEETFKRLRCTEIKQGDILVSRLPDPVGRACVIPKLDEKSITAVDCTIIRTKKEILSTEFLNYFCQSPQYFEQVKRNITGATRQRISRVLLGKTEIPLPPLSIQQNIVAKLDAIFAEIDKATAATEANAKNAEALFQSYLTQTFQRQDGNFMTRKISDIAKIKGGKRVPKGYEVKADKTPYVYLRVTDFGDNGTIDTNDLRYVDKEVHEVIKNYIINSEDLYISIAGTIGRTGIVPKNLSGSLLTENACRLVFDECINNRYVYYFTKSSNFINQTIEQTRTAAQPKLALSRLGEITLSVPSFETQKSIVSHLEKLNDEVDKLKLKYSIKVQCLKILKNSILKQAFAGELVKE